MPCGHASDQIEIFSHISTGNTYTIPIHSLLFLYYVGSPKVPPRVFGPLGPKTLRGQLLPPKSSSEERGYYLFKFNCFCCPKFDILFGVV